MKMFHLRLSVKDMFNVRVSHSSVVMKRNLQENLCDISFDSNDSPSVWEKKRQPALSREKQERYPFVSGNVIA